MRPNRIRFIAVAAILALGLGSSAAQARQDPTSTTRTARPFAQRVSEDIGIRRFAEIRPGLTRGGDPGEEGLRYLHAKGYRTVVSFLTDSAESAWVVQSGMRWVHIPMRSSFFSAQPPSADQVRQFLAVVNDSTQYPVFFHCHAGKDRTGAMTAIYRMETCGWTRDEALAEMDSFGFSSRYRKLRGFVQDYELPHPSAPADSSVASRPAINAVP